MYGIVLLFFQVFSPECGERERERWPTPRPTAARAASSPSAKVRAEESWSRHLVCSTGWCPTKEVTLSSFQQTVHAV